MSMFIALDRIKKANDKLKQTPRKTPNRWRPNPPEVDLEDLVELEELVELDPVEDLEEDPEAE
jgi:hypothetical protein